MKLQILKNKVLQSSAKKPILYDIYFQETNTQKPIIIFCHGYKGFKDWGAWDLVAEEFAKSGFFFLKFNFSHNGGTILQPIDFPDLEAFAQNNYTKELDDLDRILSYVSNTKEFEKEANTLAINLIGHSRGGGIVLIKSQEDVRVKKVSIWAGVSDYKSRFNIGSSQFNEWKEKGRFFVTNGRTKQEMPHDWQFFEDFRANEKRLTIKTAVENLKKNLLIIHGTKDTTVAIEEAKKIHSWKTDSELFLIKNATHVFGASHPWNQDNLPEHLTKVIKKTSQFLTL